MRILVISLCFFLSQNIVAQVQPVRTADSYTQFFPDSSVYRIDYQYGVYDQRVENHLPLTIVYFPSGNIQEEVYLLKLPRGSYAITVRYEDSSKKKALSAHSDVHTFEYRDGVLLRKKTRSSYNVPDPVDAFDLQPIGLPDDSPIESVGQTKVISRSTTKRCAYTEEIGSFDFFILQNGEINYYNQEHQLIKKVYVKNGRRQNDSQVNITDTLLLNALIHPSVMDIIDLNFNNRIELSEASTVQFLELHLDSLNNPKELAYFLNLKSLTVNGYAIDFKKNTNWTQRSIAIQEALSKPCLLHTQNAGGIVIPTEPLLFPQEQATFGKSQEDLMNYLVIRTNSQTGKVFASIVIDAHGRVSDVQILRGISPEIDRLVKELLRSMPRWTPAYDRGHHVASKITLPIRVVPQDQ